jgi:hypothetical protein
MPLSRAEWERVVNVALTRAKEVVYGNRSNWRDVGVFRELHAHCRRP